MGSQIATGLKVLPAGQKPLHNIALPDLWLDVES